MRHRRAQIAAGTVDELRDSLWPRWTARSSRTEMHSFRRRDGGEDGYLEGRALRTLLQQQRSRGLPAGLAKRDLVRIPGHHAILAATRSASAL